MPSTKITPEVLWAQRSSANDSEKNVVYLTINVADLQKPKIDVTSTSVSVRGFDVSGSNEVDITLELYGEIDETQTKISATARNIFLVLRKKELVEEFWPRLVKGSKKEHFIKTDFDKWVDQDEQEDEEDISAKFGGGMDFGNMDFSSMGAGGDPEPDFNDADDGSVDEEMPGLEDEQK
ncbi:Protein wos2 [Neolecta irregularis DAH-3]|uniref:Protein wos2 n=1 Tax=Neolecta irregularis (strain DAH-3) TaxID=1198029 RepID=A0A1U7LMD9_NEOID|nr:Protein wos2 [Neolecta irregularis DAH-3]|eukprot:OLL23753.1 Protein wos2 [Neolecta irregularis DAH-3]